MVFGEYADIVASGKPGVVAGKGDGVLGGPHSVVLIYFVGSMRLLECISTEFNNSTSAMR